mmetsp:Transcript_17598/g.50380  ORF Transcript_17598/g.50380 Transcript_17598/m.50380 type:complete len:117 (+) Transcript_17598:528-878(+)
MHRHPNILSRARYFAAATRRPQASRLACSPYICACVSNGSSGVVATQRLVIRIAGFRFRAPTDWPCQEVRYLQLLAASPSVQSVVSGLALAAAAAAAVVALASSELSSDEGGAYLC